MAIRQPVGVFAPLADRLGLISIPRGSVHRGHRGPSQCMPSVLLE